MAVKRERRKRDFEGGSKGIERKELGRLFVWWLRRAEWKDGNGNEKGGRSGRWTRG